MSLLRSLFLFSLLVANSSVHVMLKDAAGDPLAGVRVTLVLYDISISAEQMEARQIFSGHCRTDQNGECTIQIGETNGVLRGRLDLGRYGGRDVIWPGGALHAPVLVDLEHSRVKGSEAGPYDFQEKDGGVPLRHGTPWLVIGVAAAMAGGLVCLVYLRSRQEHT